MTEAARQARLAYRREWAKANRDKVREYNERYWDKRAAAQAAQATEAAPETLEAQQADE